MHEIFQSSRVSVLFSLPKERLTSRLQTSDQVWDKNNPDVAATLEKLEMNAAIRKSSHLVLSPKPNFSPNYCLLDV